MSSFNFNQPLLHLFFVFFSAVLRYIYKILWCFSLFFNIFYFVYMYVYTYVRMVYTYYDVVVENRSRFILPRANALGNYT